IFAASDFVLSRAGSNAIFEFLALRIPMLLIPLSRSASRGDQIINARSFKEKKYARVIQEEELTEEKLVEEIYKLKEVSPVMRDKMEAYQSEKAKERVIEIIEEMSRK